MLFLLRIIDKGKQLQLRLSRRASVSFETAPVIFSPQEVNIEPEVAPSRILSGPFRPFR